MPEIADKSRAYRYVGTDESGRFWQDVVAIRVDGTLALLIFVSFGKPPEPGLLEQVARNAAGKLA